MSNPESFNTCKSCGFSGAGDYCSRCGQPYKTKRITFSGLLHDVLHLFTHLDKGFLFTLKQLIIAPGHMQRRYIEGDRSRLQKPFSMFFICATVVALIRYWILNAVIKYYHTVDISEAAFFHEYMVVTYIALIPVYAFLAWLFFFKSGYNYAELGVMTLYTVSFLFLGSVFISSLRLIWPYVDTAYIEFPIFSIYFTITFIRFFNRLPGWVVALKSIIIMIIVFFLNQVTEDFVVRLIS